MINFTKVTATGLLMMTVAFESMAVDHLAIIGGATPGGWEIGDGLLMLPDSENPDVFNFTGYLKPKKSLNSPQEETSQTPPWNIATSLPTHTTYPSSFREEAPPTTSSKSRRAPTTMWYAILPT